MMLEASQFVYGTEPYRLTCKSSQVKGPRCINSRRTLVLITERCQGRQQRARRTSHFDKEPVKTAAHLLVQYIRQKVVRAVPLGIVICWKQTTSRVVPQGVRDSGVRKAPVLRRLPSEVRAPCRFRISIGK